MELIANKVYLVANKVSPGSSKNCCSGTSAVPRSSTANFPDKYSGNGFRLLIFNVSTSPINAVEWIFKIARTTSSRSLLQPY